MSICPSPLPCECGAGGEAPAPLTGKMEVSGKTDGNIQPPRGISVFPVKTGFRPYLLPVEVYAGFTVFDLQKFMTKKYWLNCEILGIVDSYQVL